MTSLLYPMEINDRTQMVDKSTYYFQSKRTILLTGEIQDAVAEEVAMAILYLGGQSDDDITLVINSPGGSVSAGMAIFDAMNRVPCDVATCATGMAASIAAGRPSALAHHRASPHREKTSSISAAATCPKHSRKISRRRGRSAGSAGV